MEEGLECMTICFGYVMKGEMFNIDFKGAVAQGSQNPLVECSFDPCRVILVC